MVEELPPVEIEISKLKLLTESIHSTWVPYMMAFVVIGFIVYGFETLFGIPHQEYPIDGVYMIGLCLGFIYHVFRLYSMKVNLWQSLRENEQEL